MPKAGKNTKQKRESEIPERTRRKTKAEVRVDKIFELESLISEPDELFSKKVASSGKPMFGSTACVLVKILGTIETWTRTPENEKGEIFVPLGHEISRLLLLDKLLWVNPDSDSESLIRAKISKLDRFYDTCKTDGTEEDPGKGETGCCSFHEEEKSRARKSASPEMKKLLQNIATIIHRLFAGSDEKREAEEPSNLIRLELRCYVELFAHRAAIALSSTPMTSCWSDCDDDLLQVESESESESLE